MFASTLCPKNLRYSTLVDRFGGRRPTVVQRLTSNIQPRVAGSSETSYDVESAQVGPCNRPGGSSLDAVRPRGGALVGVAVDDLKTSIDINAKHGHIPYRGFGANFH